VSREYERIRWKLRAVLERSFCLKLDETPRPWIRMTGAGDDHRSG